MWILFSLAHYQNHFHFASLRTLILSPVSKPTHSMTVQFFPDAIEVLKFTDRNP